MPSFDYITAKELRESLEADFIEMRKGADGQAWKSVHVLAGSIVESLLIDYLVSTPKPSRSNKDPLKIDLAEAITICRSEGVLSARTADLCSVVRSYRNLIHPGRMLRLDEPPPDKGSSTIALALVDMIAGELAKVRRVVAGLTAEQILSKVLRDANSLTILRHLLQEVTEQQRERLLITLIPSAFIEASRSESPFEDFNDGSAERLKLAYRAILETVSPTVRTRVASEFVRVLREEDGDRVLMYSAAFFKPLDIAFVPPPHEAMVREHILGRAPSIHTLYSLELIEGIATFLEPTDVMKWLDPFIRTLVSTTVNNNVKIKTRDHLFNAIAFTSSQVDAAVDQRLDEWIRHYEKGGTPEKAEYVRELKKDLVDIRSPHEETR